MIKQSSIDFKFDYHKFRNDIEAFLSAHNFTYLELDNLADVGTGNVSRIMRGDSRNHKMETWLRIANAMDVDVRTYFVLDV